MMSEPGPVWEVALFDRSGDTRRVWITNGTPVIRDTGVSVVELLSFLAEDEDGDPFDKWPQLETSDIDHVFRFATKCVESCGRIMWVVTEPKGEPIRVALPVEEAVCDPELMPPLVSPPQSPLHIRVLALGAGMLMASLSLLVGYFLLLQLLWGV